jgi:two-component system chemotaxis response regulator CheY
MRHCLIVDDSSVIRKVARRILEDFDFSVSEAEDGRAALEACRRSMPDMILLDWHLPVMDGLEFLANLRQMDNGKRPKVVFCASEADVAQIARALRAGADEYILKPFDRSAVEAKLHEVGML